VLPVIGVATFNKSIGLCHGITKSNRARMRGSVRLQVVQEIRRMLRVRRCAEYRRCIALQRRYPRRNMGRVIFPNLRRKFEVGATERCAKLGKPDSQPQIKQPEGRHLSSTSFGYYPVSLIAVQNPAGTHRWGRYDSAIHI